MSKVVMSWSKCKIAFGKTGANDAMASTLTELENISDKSTSLSVEDGEKLEAKVTGGILLAEEEGEHIYTLTTRIKEPSFALESALTGATSSDDALLVKTNIVSDDISVKVTPKNIGAIGIAIRKSHLVVKPGYSEEEGHWLDLTFKVLVCEDGELYKKFRVKQADWTPSSPA